MLLQTYTTLTGEALISQLPPFLNVGMDVTEDAAFSMYNLSLREDWADNKKFCHKMYEDHENPEPHEIISNETREAQNRYNANKSIV